VKVPDLVDAIVDVTETGSSLRANKLRILETIIDESVVREIIPQLKALGAEGIIEYPLNKVVY